MTVLNSFGRAVTLNEKDYIYDTIIMVPWQPTSKPTIYDSLMSCLDIKINSFLTFDS